MKRCARDRLPRSRAAPPGVVSRRACSHTARAMPNARPLRHDSDEALMLAYGAGDAAAFDVALRATQGRRVPLSPAPLPQCRHRRRTVPGRVDERDPRPRDLRAHRQVHHLAVHARAPPARRSLARKRPGEVHVGRRRRRRRGARDRRRDAGRRATTSPRRARRPASSARNCTPRCTRCRPSSATHSCCSTKAGCRSRRSPSSPASARKR